MTKVGQLVEGHVMTQEAQLRCHSANVLDRKELVLRSMGDVHGELTRLRAPWMWPPDASNNSEPGKTFRVGKAYFVTKGATV